MAAGTKAYGLALAAFFLASGPAEAVIFYSTGDPAYNTTAPASNLAGSGWQFQGFFGSFLGTPIAPNFFITVGHIGGVVGQEFVFQGVSYPTTAVYDDPNTDLRIWSVCGTFPAYAALYTATSEVGKGVVVFGRGTRRGDPVTSTNQNTIKTHGWLWGGNDNVLRWGENTIARTMSGDPFLGDRTIGELLVADFDATGGPNECQFSNGDSGGAMFINDGGVWKLAGMNYSVSPPYNRSATGTGFNAAMFDEGGFYIQNGNLWTFQPDVPAAQPGSFYGIRVSSRGAWINSIIAGVAPGSSLILQSSPQVGGPFTDVTEAVVDNSARTITIAQPASTRFYRLRSCGQKRIKQIRPSGSNLVLEFE